MSCPAGCQSWGAGRERFALGLTGCNTSGWGSHWAAKVLFSDGSDEFCHSPYRNLNVCGQIESCLYSLDAVEVGGNAH